MVAGGAVVRRSGSSGPRPSPPRPSTPPTAGGRPWPRCLRRRRAPRPGRSWCRRSSSGSATSSSLAPTCQNSASIASADLGPGRNGLTALPELRRPDPRDRRRSTSPIRWSLVLPGRHRGGHRDPGRALAKRRSDVGRPAQDRPGAHRGRRSRVGILLGVADRPAGRHRRRGPRRVVPGRASSVGPSTRRDLRASSTCPVLAASLTYVYRLRRDAGVVEPAEPAAGASG